MNYTQYYIYSNIAKDAMCFWVSNREDFLIIPFVVFYCSSSLFKYLIGQIKTHAYCTFLKSHPFFLTHALSNMDAKFGLQSRIQSLFPTAVKIYPWRITKLEKHCSPYVHAFLNRQLNASIRSQSSQTSTTGPSGNVYVDNWYDRLAINHLSQSFQAATG